LGRRKKEKSTPPADDGPPPPKETPAAPEEDEAEVVERVGKDAIDSALILPQPDLRNLEDGFFTFESLK
jgi:hypothetical protein